MWLVIGDYGDEEGVSIVECKNELEAEQVTIDMMEEMAHLAQDRGGEWADGEKIYVCEVRELYGLTGRSNQGEAEGKPEGETQDEELFHMAPIPIPED